MGAFIQWTVQRHHIALLQEVVKRSFLYIKWQLLLRLARQRHHLHAERLGNLSHATANVAQPDDADGLANEFRQVLLLLLSAKHKSPL